MTDILITFPRKVITREFRRIAITFHRKALTREFRRIAFGPAHFYRHRSRATGVSTSGATYALATKGHTPVASGEQSGSGWARCRKHTYTLRRQNMSVSDYPRLMVLEYDSRWATPGASARDMAVPGETRMMEV